MSKHHLGVVFDIDEYQWVMASRGLPITVAISDMSKRDLRQALCYCIATLADIDSAMKRIGKYERGNIGEPV